MKYILIGSNDGTNCEVLAVSEENKVIDAAAAAAMPKFDIITSFSHYGHMDGSVPTVGHKFVRPVPLTRNLNQPWYKKKGKK